MPLTFQASIIIPHKAWDLTGDEDDPSSRLYASIEINGLAMHVEAHAVKNDKDGNQVAANPYFQREVENYQNAQDTGFTTIRMRGRNYIIVCTPFGN